jgi:hypothetical protein
MIVNHDMTVRSFTNGRNLIEVTRYLKIAADGGDLESLCQYGFSPGNCLGTERNIEGVIESLKRATDIGNRESQFDVSQLLLQNIENLKKP